MKPTKYQINKELKDIQHALKGFKNGASLEVLRNHIGLKLSNRTLQRRLKILIDDKVVRIEGSTSSIRYHLIQKTESAKTDSKGQTGGPSIESFIPFSPEGQEILGLITQPIETRKPAGYNFEFLLSYIPNKSSYLTPENKQQLSSIGKTSDARLPGGTYARDIFNRLIIDLSWNSSRLEGNTYSLLETTRLLNLGEAADDKSAEEAQMILNHKDAIEFLLSEGADIGLNPYTIRNLHALLSHNLLPNSEASGRLRHIIVNIQKSVFTPLGVPQQIQEMFELILSKASEIEDPFEQAFFLMVHLPYLQPFEDVNKRVSRLAVNIPLNKHNLAPLSFTDVPKDLYISALLGIYELNRVELMRDVFVWAYSRSAARFGAIQQSLGRPDLFKLKYREDIRALISDIISNAQPPKEATVLIKRKAEDLPEDVRSKFIETVEAELLSLHEGNFARYYIRLSEFVKWKQAWTDII